LESRSGDAVIRSELRAYLAVLHAEEPATVVLDELGLRRRAGRADVVVVNGVLHGYEIKSDRDSLRRLARQTLLYGEIFDQVTLVVGPRYALRVLDLVPCWWGVLEIAAADTDAKFAVRREGTLNPSRSPRALVELLWRDASLALLNARGASRGYRSRPRREIWDRICELFSLDEISAAVRSALTARPARGSGPLPS
jgi:hypothetical protein